jgi:nitrate reductase gamma subunit
MGHGRAHGKALQGALGLTGYPVTAKGRRRAAKESRTMGRLDFKAVRNGVIASLLLVLGIYFGSAEMRDFDPALIAYTGAVVIATFGVTYRYSIWLQKPPTRLYWRRGWQVFLRPARIPANLLHLARLLWKSIVLQTFIERRGRMRWTAHFLLSWGCIVAVMVTFPLVFGWIHFEADPRNPAVYQALVFGIYAGTFPASSPVGWMTFHILDFCAVAVIAGMALAMRRRVSDEGAMSLQSFSMDFLPLILLFTVSVTGLMLTVSALWLHGYSYNFIAQVHAFSVILTLLYLPFGKFFHIFQRPANLGVQFYKQEGRETEAAKCVRCGEEFTSKLHTEDLKVVLEELGMDYRCEDGTHFQDVCPRCRRRLLAVNQLEEIGGPGFL